ncbi:hypothetical protein [Wolbachia endosymbiont (group B) of Ischnura elegans]|uniref:hypothetical protein n=1 Tax=Wolbachia endosymbiont (group B) of Ischnura elegans TaxID=2954021 RepID=UPI00222EED09|nr:hypothetical protein [Wolbachia endosymbiont (group B) of Ischnura elegans]
MKISQTNNMYDLYTELISAIEKRKDITALLKKVEKKDLLTVLHFPGLHSKIFVYAIMKEHYRSVQSIIDVAKENGILKEFLIGKISQYELITPLQSAIMLKYYSYIRLIINLAKENGVLKEVLDVKGVLNQKDFLKIFLKENKDQDTLNEIYKIEKSIATNRAIRVGSVCSVVTALAVGGGLFAAGVALQMLTLIGIAVAAALVTGLVAGGITYKISKPSEKLDSVDAEQKLVQRQVL